MNKQIPLILDPPEPLPTPNPGPMRRFPSPGPSVGDDKRNNRRDYIV